MLRPFAACIVLLALSTELFAFQETTDPSRFELTELSRGLVQPMELCVAPDGTVYFIELAGKLRALR
ncbi:MAG: hypothetical protein U0996_27280, partial [Planctomycetaceae bacterium]